MDKESKLSSCVQTAEHKQQRRQRDESAELHTASSLFEVSPNPSVSSRGNWSKKTAGKWEDVPRSHGYSSSRPVREGRDGSQQRDRSTWDTQAKTRSRIMSRKSTDAQKQGFREARSAPNSAGKAKPAQTNMPPFEVKMADFPELAGVPQSTAVSQKDCWGLSSPPANPPTLKSSWKSGRRESPTPPDSQRSATNTQPDISALLAGQPVVTSWANIASQPPKKPVPVEKTISSNHMQKDETAAQQEDGAVGKKKRKKKKKAKNTEMETLGTEEAVAPKEPPKFEDEEEFPGLAVALPGAQRFITGKLCNEENQREGNQHQSTDQNKEKVSKTQPTETAKKGQKAEKVSGKKSKVPVQLDIGNMLAALEKKQQQSQKANQDAKPLILSVGGGLPVVPKRQAALKKPPWQQDKIAHNPLDSTSPLVKKGKQREVPKAKKPTPLKKVILKEREERKQKRLLEERGLLPEDETRLTNEATEEEQCDEDETEEVSSPTEEGDDQLNGTDEMEEEADEDTTTQDQTASPEPCLASVPKIHSRKFRDYCSQMLSKDLDLCVTNLLKELVRFQDRLYQKDPMKARMKRRIVMGLREVLKHLKLKRVKCVIISPNCERIQSKGGLDDALYTIINTCREQGVPFVFALSRKALGRCVNKAVPVSLVGIFNYDGAQDFYHKMIELSSEARKAYEVMSLEQRGQEEEEANTDELLNSDADAAQPEEPEYIKIWKKMLEKEYNHKCLKFEEQLSSMHLDSECTENTGEDERS